MSPMKERWNLILGGHEVETDRLMDVINPFTGGVVAMVCRAGINEANKALDIAHNARPVMAKLPAYRKAEILSAISNKLSERKEELARTITLENGKPIKESRGEAERSAFTFRVAAEEAVRIGGEFIPLERNALSEGRWGLTRRFPAGPVLGITPFNFPLNLVAHKVAPAIASGNPIILKPASKTPLSALLLAEIIIEAGLPEGGLSVIPCDSATAEMAALDARIKVLSFTGSATVGWALKARVPHKKVLLELGGNAGVVVDEGADLDYAAKRCVIGAFSFAGQVCISVQRIYLHKEIYKPFMDRFIPLVKGLRTGDPLLDETDVGPVIDKENMQRIGVWLGEAIDKGARVITGNERKDNIFMPTVLEDTTPDMKVNCMEVFAPVVTTRKIDSFEEGLHAVNDSPYGLQAGVFTRDLKHAFQAFEELEVGGVIVNDVPAYRIDHMPYGGVKQSGFGREGIKYAIEEMTELRLMALNLK